MERSATLGLSDESLELIAKLGVVGLRDGVVANCKFHLAEVNDAVGALNQHINLRIILLQSAAPRHDLRLHGLNAERLSNCRNMSEANFLEGKAAPRSYGRTQLIVLPKGRVRTPFLIDKTQVEKRIEVNEFIVNLALRSLKAAIRQDEIAHFECLEYLRQAAEVQPAPAFYQ